MKKFLITLGLVFGMLFFSTGCEGDGKAQPQVAEEPTLHFDRDGEYDLSGYLFPKSEQINFYALSEYIDNTGKRSYSDSDKNTSYYSLKYLKSEGNKTEEFQEDILKRAFEVQVNKIQTFISEENRTVEMVKYADINDYLSIDEFTIEEGDKSREFSMLCQANKHFSSYEEHEDVLKVSCRIHESRSLTFEGSEGKTSKSGTYNLWFAKEIGMVYAVKDMCTETTFDAISKKSCKKEIRKWLNDTTI